MSKFSNPFLLKNPINQIAKEKIQVAKKHVEKVSLPPAKRSETGKFGSIKKQPLPERIYVEKQPLKPLKMNDDSPVSKLGCGGKGCIRKRGNEWVILNNKKAGYPVWRSGFKSEADAKKMLSAYHANS